MGAELGDGPVVFVVYAQRDQREYDWRERVELFLGPAVQKEETLDGRPWELFIDKGRIPVGADWQDRVDQAIDRAALAIVLVGPHFFESEFITNHELPRLQARGVELHILFTDHFVHEQASEISRYQGFNQMDEPLSKLAPTEAKELIARFGNHIIKRIRSISSEPVFNAESGANPRPEAGRQQAETSSRPRQPRFGKLPRLEAFFFGGETLLPKIRGDLINDDGKRNGMPLVVTGLFGIGKTQTVAQYAHRYCDEYPGGIFWIGTDYHAAELARMAKEFNLPIPSDGDASDAAKQWLETQDDWLLVFDAVDDLQAFQSYIPNSSRGDILLTTRLRGDRPVPRAKLEGLEPTDGATLLLRCAKILRADEWVEPLLDVANDFERPVYEGAIEISRRLGGHPGLLAEIGFQIEDENIAVGEYVDRLSQRGLRVDRRLGFYDAFKVEFETAAQDDKIIPDLLYLCAQLAPREIPQDIFEVGGRKVNAGFRSKESEQLANAFRLATRRNLVVRDPQRQTVTIDRLVREILLGNLSESEQRPDFEFIAAVLAETIPETPGKQRADLLEHASHIAREATGRGGNVDITPERMLRIASYLCDHDKHDEALALFRRGLEQREVSLGNQHPALLPFLKGMVRVAMCTGSLKAARDYSRRALKIRQTEKGNDAPELAADHEALARIYEEMDNSEAALRHHTKALAIKNKGGSNSPSLESAAALHQLGVDYYHRKKYRHATRAFKDALDMRRQATYSRNNEQLATGYNNLALSCGMLALGERKLNHQEDASKNYQVAKQHFVRAMRLLEDDTATTESKMLALLEYCERNLEWLKRSWGE